MSKRNTYYNARITRTKILGIDLDFWETAHLPLP